MKPRLLLLSAALLTFTCAQAQVPLKIKRTKMTVEVGKEDVVIPVEFEIINSSDSTVPVSVELERDERRTTVGTDALAFVSERAKKLTFLATKPGFLRGNSTARAFYIDVKREVGLQADATLVYSVDLQFGSGVVSTADSLFITLTKSKDQVYALDDYLADPKVKLEYVTKVESTNNVLTVYGYHNHDGNAIGRRQIALNKAEAYNIHEFLSPYRLQASLLSIPFKVRPKQGSLMTNASAGVSNLGLNLDFIGYKLDRYYSNGNKLSLRFAPGGFIAPGVEELDSAMTEGFLKGAEKSKQLFISAGLTLTLSINSVSFVYTPLAYDIATNDMGKQWVYNRRRWWGFGIGIDPKVLSNLIK